MWPLSSSASGPGAFPAHRLAGRGVPAQQRRRALAARRLCGGAVCRPGPARPEAGTSGLAPVGDGGGGGAGGCSAGRVLRGPRRPSAPSVSVPIQTLREASSRGGIIGLAARRASTTPDAARATMPASMGPTSPPTRANGRLHRPPRGQGPRRANRRPRRPSPPPASRSPAAAAPSQPAQAGRRAQADYPGRLPTSRRCASTGCVPTSGLERHGETVARGLAADHALASKPPGRAPGDSAAAGLESASEPPGTRATSSDRVPRGTPRPGVPSPVVERERLPSPQVIVAGEEVACETLLGYAGAYQLTLSSTLAGLAGSSRGWPT